MKHIYAAQKWATRLAAMAESVLEQAVVEHFDSLQKVRTSKTVTELASRLRLTTDSDSIKIVSTSYMMRKKQGNKSFDDMSVRRASTHSTHAGVEKSRFAAKPLPPPLSSGLCFL